MEISRLRYVHNFKDRHEKQRYYFRRGDQQIALPSDPGSPEFLEAYNKALGTQCVERLKIQSNASKVVPGSVADVTNRWVSSSGFRKLDPHTQSYYFRYALLLKEQRGDFPIRQLQRRHVKEILRTFDEAGKPVAGNFWLRTIKQVLRFALDELEIIEVDVTQGIKKLRYESEGYKTWMPEHIETFRYAYPLGTMPRLALELLLGIGCRRDDVWRLGWQHIRNGELSYTQRKNIRHSVKRVSLVIPVITELQTAIDATPGAKDRLVFLLNEHHQPFREKRSFGIWFARKAQACGLKRLPGERFGFSPHGLRKALLTQLANEGKSVHQLAAVSGHRTLAQLEVYTRQADQPRLARQAFGRSD